MEGWKKDRRSRNREIFMKGKVIRIFPPDTNTDEIISGKYKYDELDMEKLAVHTFESIDKNFYEDSKGEKNPIIIAAGNFGCGSSREQAPQVLKACGISYVIAESFARIFYRNCFNVGIPAIECARISESVSEGDELEVDYKNGKIKNLAKKEEYEFKPISGYMQEILNAGGLMPHVRKKGGF